jgi:hypothetical protein
MNAQAKAIDAICDTFDALKAGDTRTPIKLELDAEQDRRAAVLARHNAKFGYFDESRPGDVALRLRYLREADELDASAARNEARALDLRSVAA